MAVILTPPRTPSAINNWSVGCLPRYQSISASQSNIATFSISDDHQMETGCRCKDCKDRFFARRNARRAVRIQPRTETTLSRNPRAVMKTRCFKGHSLIDPVVVKEQSEDDSDQSVSDFVWSLYRPKSTNFFAIENTQMVSQSLQYFHEVFLGSVHPIKDVPIGWKPMDFYKNAFPRIMRDPMWFPALVVFSDLLKQRTVFGTAEKSTEMLKYSAAAVKNLREKLLADESQLTDAVILTITTLMSIDLITRNMDEMGIHLQGLERVIKVKGGLNNFNGDGSYIKYKVLGFQTYWLFKQPNYGTSPDYSYPKYPFSPELCVAIARLPDELRELALDRSINATLLKLMGDIFQIASNFKSSEFKSNEDLRRLKYKAYELEELVSMPEPNLIEPYLLVAFMLYCICHDDQGKMHWLLKGVSQMCSARLRQIPVDIELAPKTMLWTGAILISVTEANCQASELGHKLLTLSNEKKHLTRDYMLETCQEYLWDGNLTRALEEKLGSNLQCRQISQRRSESPTDSGTEMSDRSTASPRATICC